MATTTVDIVVKTLGTNKLDRLDKSLKSVDRAADQVAGSTGKAANGIGKTGRAASRASKDVDKFGQAVRRAVGGLALLSAARFVFGKTAELERTTKQLATVTGSLETAKGILNELQVINKQSPFSFIQLADTAKRLSAFGIDTKDLVASTERLGKAAAATGAQVNDLALAYGQVAAKGKLQTEELYQFQERGIPLLDELAKGYGKTKGEVQALITEGRVGFPAVEQAIKNLTTGNGKFAKAFENTADTLDAKLSNAIDSLGRAAAAFGELLKPRVIELLKGAEAALTDITGVLKSIPQPAVDVALKFAEFAAKAFLVSKALKAIIALKAGIAGVLATTATGAATAGNASAAAAIKVNALATALLRLAAIGIVTVGVNYVVNGIASGARQEELVQGLENGEFDNTLENVPYEQAQAALRAEEKVLTGLLAKRDKLQEDLKSAGTGLAGLIPGLAPARIGAIKGQLNEVNASIEKSQRILSSKTQAPPTTTEDVTDPFNLIEGNGKGKGKAGGGRKGPQPKTDDLENLQRQIQLEKDLGVLQGKRFKAEMANDDLAVVRIDGQIALRNLQEQQADALAGMNTEAGRVLQTQLAEVQATNQVASNTDEEIRLQRSKAEAIDDALRPLEEQKRVLEATLNGRGEEERQLIQIENIMKGLPESERAKVEQLVKGNAELQKQLDQAAELKALYAQIGSRVADGLVEGITAAIDGTKTLQEILSDVLKDVSKMLLQFAVRGLGASIGLPGFADGGRPEVNKLSIVGEKGPELFVPDTAGTIIPNDAFAEARGAMGLGGSSSASPESGLGPDSPAAVAAFATNNSTLTTTNSYMKERAMERESQTTIGSAGSMVIETQVINNVEYASVEQLQKATAASARQARAQVFSDLKNKPSARASVGMR